MCGVTVWRVGLQNVGTIELVDGVQDRERNRCIILLLRVIYVGKVVFRVMDRYVEKTLVELDR